MAGFLRAYGQILRRISSESIMSMNPEKSTAFTGDALASAGNTVLERLHIGIMALMGHPIHVSYLTVYSLRLKSSAF